jgi:hypothetical protein
MSAEFPAQLAQQQRDRLKHIELRLRFLGEVRRGDLMARFGIKSAAASRDLALYKDLAPFNAEFDKRSKWYVLGPAFTPLFETETNQALSWLVEQVGDVVAPTGGSLLPCCMPVRLTTPKLDALAAVSRAIHLRQALQIRYHSISSGQTEREIVPFALLDTGLRWHVRAYDRKTAEFRDFVLTRIQDAKLCGSNPPQSHELAENDAQWTRIVDLQLVPHPKRPRPDVTCMDYGMEGGSLSLKVRAAIAGYVLRRWSVDCSPDHTLSGPEHRLWLRDHLALHGVKSATIAPGYQASPVEALSHG